MLPGLLIVDDDPGVRAALAEAFGDAGYHLVTAATGRDALDRLTTHAIDVVLLDLRLPDMCGVEVLRAFKARDPELEVILLTAFATVETAVSAIKGQAFHYLPKPFDVNVLIPLVAQAARLRVLRRELRAATSRAEALAARYRELDLQHRLSEIVLDARDPSELLERILVTVMDAGRFDGGRIGLRDGPAEASGTCVHAGAELASEVLGPAFERLRRDAAAGCRSVLGLVGPATAPTAAWAVVVPIRAADRVVGFLELVSRESRPVPPDELRLLDALGSQIGVALAKARADAQALAAERERAQALAAHAEMAAVVEASPDLVAIVDDAGGCRYLNPAARRLLGVEHPAPLAAVSIDAFRPSRTAALLREVALPAAAREGLWRGEATLERHGGDPLAVSIVVVAHRAETGAPFYSVIAHDLSEQRAIERHLRVVQKFEAIGQLAGGVAHDFNTYLTVIGGYAEVLQGQFPPGAPARRDIDEIARAAAKAATLIRQLLAFSRRQVMQPRLLDLNAAVAESRGLCERLLGPNRRLVLVPAPSLPAVLADPSQLEQVLLNLVSNARDAMPDGGTVTIETAQAVLDEAYVRRHVGARVGPHVALVVRDTGHGMPAEVQAHVFEPFFTTKAPGHGTGLGLSTVYGIVKQSGGSIWVYTEVGRGTTFKVFLPAATTPEAPGGAAVREGAPPRGTETILLAEDDESIRALAGDALTAMGYRVLTAKDGLEAARVAAEHSEPIDLLLTDVVMPGLSGPELAARLSGERPGLRVLFMSGYAEPQFAAQVGLGRPRALLQKPFALRDLGRQVRAVLDASGPSPLVP